MDDTAPTIIPVVLSGGAGTRLWPLSHDQRPKQLQPLLSERSMLQETLLRAAGPGGFQAPWIVANAAHVDEIRRQAAAVGVAPAGLAVEPVGRNTAPAVIAAAHLVRASGAAEEDLLLVTPADHYAPDAEAFRAAARLGAQAAAEGALVAFGVRPNAPETGYGYILRGAPRGAAYAVERFVEKPDPATARAFLAHGGYFWNAGVFLFRIDAILKAARTHCPDIEAAAAAAAAEAERTGDVAVLAERRFTACRADSIDYAIMEAADNVAMAPAEFAWSDIGSWSALADLSPADADGNVLVGEVVALESQGCYIRADEGLAAVVGLKDVILVRTNDMVMAAPKAYAQDVKRLVEEVRRRTEGGGEPST